VGHRPALRLVLTLHADDIDHHLLFHQLGQHTQADTDAQRQQPLTHRAEQLPERPCIRGGNASSLPLRSSRDTVSMAVPPVSIDDFALATVAARTGRAGKDRHLKFCERRDNLAHRRDSDQNPTTGCQITCARKGLHPR
jgi:hypothetical protein